MLQGQLHNENDDDIDEEEEEDEDQAMDLDSDMVILEIIKSINSIYCRKSCCLSLLVLDYLFFFAGK